jgi:hypothetical protein
MNQLEYGSRNIMMNNNWKEPKLSTYLNPNYKITVDDTQPFHHVIIDDIFVDSYYKNVVSLFDRFLENGLVEDYNHLDNLNNLCKVRWYDAYSQNISPMVDVSRIWFSKEWHEFISSFFPEIEFDKNKILEIQHHLPNSPAGYVHNDWDVAYFYNDPLPNDMNVWFYNCGYRAGCQQEGENEVKSFRAVAMIYYFNTDERWDEDGGDTGLFESHVDKSLFAKIKPINNRLAMYEMTPYSWHAFMKSGKFTRTALHSWFHQSQPSAQSRFPNHDLYENVKSHLSGGNSEYYEPRPEYYLDNEGHFDEK